MATQVRDDLIHWLRDAYAMESQAVKLIEHQMSRLQHYPEFQRKLQEHLEETKRQQVALEEAFNFLDADPSAFKQNVMVLGANIQGMLQGLAGDEVVKYALSNYTFECFEAASYRILVAAAERAKEDKVARICADIQRQEEAMGKWFWEQLPETTRTYFDRLEAGTEAKR